MFGLTFEKLLIISAFIIGPQRLPLCAGKLGAFVRAFRVFADAAKTRVAAELGPEFQEVDWQKLDPRQYDPRRIVRAALSDDSEINAALPPAPKTATGAPAERG